MANEPRTAAMDRPKMPESDEATSFERYAVVCLASDLKTYGDQCVEFGRASVVVTEEMIRRACMARIPGGSEAWHWVLGGGVAITDNHRDWFRLILTAALGGGE